MRKGRIECLPARDRVEMIEMRAYLFEDVERGRGLFNPRTVHKNMDGDVAGQHRGRRAILSRQQIEWRKLCRWHVSDGDAETLAFNGSPQLAQVLARAHETIDA
jgi:hypothetical protein